MFSIKALTATAFVAIAISGATAGPCKPTPLSSTGSPTPTATVLPTPTNTEVVSTPTASLCTLVSDAASLGDTVCGRAGSLDASNDAAYTQVGLSLEECATLANNFDGIEGQTGAGSFLYDSSLQVCKLFANRAASVDSFTLEETGAYIQYDFNCFECPQDEEDSTARCSFLEEAPEGKVCQDQGELYNGPQYVRQTIEQTTPWDCLNACDQDSECLTISYGSDSVCTLYSQDASVLNYAADGSGFFVSERDCFVCDAHDSTSSRE